MILLFLYSVHLLNVFQVLDEIGIEISGKIAGAPQAAKGAVGGSETEKGLSDADIEKQLEMLKM